MEKKVVVPGFMRKAAREAAIRVWQIPQRWDAPNVADAAVEAALLALSENPIVPTDAEMACAIVAAQRRYQAESPVLWEKLTEWRRAILLMVEWQKRMFLAPGPEVPEEIVDLLQILPTDGSLSDPWKRLPADETNARIIAAFRRGQAAK